MALSQQYGVLLLREFWAVFIHQGSAVRVATSTILLWPWNMQFGDGHYRRKSSPLWNFLHPVDSYFKVEIFFCFVILFCFLKNIYETTLKCTSVYNKLFILNDQEIDLWFLMYTLRCPNLRLCCFRCFPCFLHRWHFTTVSSSIICYSNLSRQWDSSDLWRSITPHPVL
jgi:hypothetical protein